MGTRLPDDVLDMATATRGELTIRNHRSWNGHGGRRSFIIATFNGIVGSLPVPDLLYAEVTNLAGNEFTVSGTEVHVPNPQPGVSFQCGQTWWCRLALREDATIVRKRSSPPCSNPTSKASRAAER